MSQSITVGEVTTAIVTYCGERVCTTQQLAQFYGCGEKHLQDNFANNRERFEEGKHFVLLEGQAFRSFKVGLPDEIGEPLKFAPKAILWTERGAARHAKMLSTEGAWEVFEQLEDCYFSADRAKRNSRAALATPLRATAEAAKAFPALVRCARLLGCDKNAAAISANQAIYAITDINLMQQLGHTHIKAAEQDSQWYTPTELGGLIDTSARGMNLLLAEAGLQVKMGEKWESTDAGRDFARLFDTGKKHGAGVPVMQMKWSRNVLPLIGSDKEAA